MATQLGYITISYRDAIGVTANTTIPVTYDDSVTLATILTQVLTIANADIALSECAVKDVKFTVVPPNPGPFVPTADSDANEGLLENFNIAGSRYTQEIWTPGLLDALIVNGKIDLTNATLIAFTNALTTGANVKGANKFGDLIVSVADAAESFRKLRRQSVKKTRSTT